MFSTDTTAHAGVMDRVYRGQRHIYDLTRKYYLLGRDRLLDDLDPAPGAHVLELGCGTARNLILAARRYPDCYFYGVDASTEMLKTASRAVARARLSDHITLAHGFAELVDPVQTFRLPRKPDVVFLSYSLSMIPDWKGTVRHAFSITAPTGRVMVVDFGDQSGLPTWFGRALFAWLQKFHVAPRLDLVACFDQAARDNRRNPYACSLYRGYAQYLVSQ